MKNIAKTLALCFIALAPHAMAQELLSLETGGGPVPPPSPDQSAAPGKFLVESPANKTVDSDMPGGVSADQSRPAAGSSVPPILPPGTVLDIKSLTTVPPAPAAGKSVTINWELSPSDTAPPMSLVVVKQDVEEKVVNEILSNYWKAILPDRLEETLSRELTFWKVTPLTSHVEKSQSRTIADGFPEGKYRIFLAAAGPVRGTTIKTATFEVIKESAPAEIAVTKPVSGEVLAKTLEIGVATKGLAAGEMLTAKISAPSAADVVKDFDPQQGLQIDLADGDYTLSVSRALNPGESAAPVSFTMKTTPPVQPKITITQPADGAVLAQGMIPITWKTAGETPDDENTAFTISISKAGAPDTANSKTKNKQHEDQLESGTYTVTVTRPGYAPANVAFTVEGGNGLLFGALGVLAAGGGALALKKLKGKKRSPGHAAEDEELV